MNLGPAERKEQKETERLAEGGRAGLGARPSQKNKQYLSQTVRTERQALH